MFHPDLEIIPAPSDATLWPVFREQLRSWRDEARRQLSYDDALYGKPEFAWAASSYACCFLMLCDLCVSMTLANRPLHGPGVRRRAAANSAAMTASSSGTPTRASAWMSGTSLISIGTCQAV